MADNTNAYATIQPLQANVSDWVNNQEIMGARQREEQRRIAELDRLAKEREQKKKDDLLNRYKNIKGAAPTGIKSIDDAQRMWMDQAMDKRLELYKKEYSGQKLTPQEEALYQKLDSTPETLALMAKAYTAEQSRYNELVAKGEIKRDSKYELAMQKLADGAMPFIDDDGNPVIGVDDDGDGKPDVISFDPNAGFSFKPRYIPDVPIDSVIDGIAKNLKAEENQTDNNYLKVKTTGVPLTAAQELAKGAVYDAKGGPSPFAVSYFYDAGIDPENINPEQLAELEKEVANRIVLSKERGVVRDRDYSAETSRMSENRQARKAAKEDKEYSLDDIYNTTVTKVNGVPTKNNYQGNVKIERKVGSAVESFSSFGLDNNGNVVVTVDVSTPKYTDAAIESMTSELEGEERIKREEELRQVQQITKKTYNEKQADDVTYYAQRFKNPRTGSYVKDLHELERELKKRGQDELGEPEKQKIQGF